MRIVLLRCVLLTLALSFCPASFSLADERPTTEQLVFFEKKIRPLLKEHCIQCHGPKKAEGGLRLDSRKAILTGGDRGPAIELGLPEESLLITALTYDEPDLSMPPDGKLPAEAIKDFERWIEWLAPWPEEKPKQDETSVVERAASHWAFQPLRSPPVPQFDNQRFADWGQHPIDAFIYTKLEAHRLHPSRRASPATLIRRASLDLCGVPPSHQEVQRFVEASRRRPQQSWERLIEELCSRRTYGERWARHWLDVARYADTKGYVDGGKAEYAFAYTYRDYVIRAMCEDLPFDEMVIDQLAAEQRNYAPEDTWRLAGMGYLTVGRRFNHNHYDTLDDRIDVIGRGLLALTFTCARCHDHKYDPISQADYYSLYGILCNSVEPQHDNLPILRDKSDTHDSPEHIEALRKQATANAEAVKALRQTIAEELRSFATDYLRYLVKESDAHRLGQQNPLNTDRTILRAPTAYGFGAIRRWRYFIETRPEHDPLFSLWHHAFDADANEVPTAILSHLESDRVLNTKLRELVVRRPPQTMLELADLYGKQLESYHQQWQPDRGHPPTDRTTVTSTEQAWWDVLYGIDSPAVLSDLDAVDCYHLDEHTKMRNLAGEVEEISLDQPSAAPRAMILTRRNESYQPFVFLRGRPDRRGPDVDLRLPDLLADPVSVHKFDRNTATSDQSPSASGRLDVARALVSPAHPLTARVIVNRVWDWHFGQPLVSTPSDFGLRSSPPSHPELLDHLATWFIEHDWSLKQLHRYIMSSSTYQQASEMRQAAHQLDPTNRWMWRYQPHRLEWEAIRDSLLFVSGQLEPRLGGRPDPHEPDDPKSICRTIYIRIDRQNLSAFSRHFDFPAPDFTVPRRPVTTVPQQQLFFLNSPFVLKQATRLGRQAVRVSGDDQAKLDWLFKTILAREVQVDSTRAALLELVEQLRQTNQDGSDVETWSTIAQALLQSNEFVYLE